MVKQQDIEQQSFVTKNSTQKIGMEYLQTHGQRFDYSDGDIIILNSLDALLKAGSMEVEMVLIVVVMSGRIETDHNGKPITVNEKQMLICPPGVYLDNLKHTDDFKGVIFGLSYNKFLMTVCSGLEIWTLLLYAQQHPVFSLLDIDMDIVDGYFLVVQKKLQTSREFYYKEILHSLMEAIFYEICVVINREIKPAAKNDEGSHGNFIFRRFIEQISINGGKERSVNYYAKELCITPKYLSSVTKSMSGKPALEWILGYTTDGIAHELKYSSKSIKEIANEYNFPTISSFGKFFKKRMGISPREYRQSK